MDNSILQVKNVSKVFPGVKALDNVSIDIKKGEIHALVGENGAGKSTLMKILNGNYKKDGGKIIFDGKEVELDNPISSKKLGISIIFQELNLIPTLSVAENIFLGRLPQKDKRVDWNAVYTKAKEALDRIGYDLDLREMVSKLSVAQRQMVEIAKALSYDNTRIVLMDEPSATLTSKECEVLFKVVKELKAQGISVIYISHRMEEIFEIADHVTVIRDGTVIDSRPIGEFTKDDITEKMIGRQLNNEFPKRSGTMSDEEVLKVENLCVTEKIRDINFTLHKGEILGLAGLVGAGRTEIVKGIYGLDYIKSGDIYLKGKKVKLHSPADSIRHGMCYLSEDRKNEGLVGTSTVKWNLVMANFKRILTGGLLDAKKEKAVAEASVESLNIKTPSVEQIAFNLSGGNQQKIVVGKWLNTEADIFIFDEPTRGIDVGSKYEIYLLINKLVDEGKSVIFISSELPEVLGMSDRVLVIKDGHISAELTGENITAQQFIKYAI